MKTRFRIATFATVLWILIMRLYAPINIIELEFARTLDNALEIFLKWGAGGVEMAKVNLYFDFVLLVLYSWAIGLGCRVAGNYAGVVAFSRTGLFLYNLMWVAAACDFIENVSLLITIQKMNEGLLELAFWMALSKFAIVIMALLFIITATGTGLLKHFYKK